jgi:hypothetical protein
MRIEYFSTGVGEKMVRYYNSGALKRAEWRVADVLHRKDGPALIKWNDRGIYELQWWIHGVFYGKKARRSYGKSRGGQSTTHHRDGDATITRIYMGDVIRTERRVNNRLHAEGEPAVVVHFANGVKKVQFWHHGQRAQGVAEIIYGCYYNEFGAIVYKKTIIGARTVSRYKTYYNYKKTIRENSLLHCTTGPAKIWGDNSRRYGVYYLDGVRLEEDEWRERVRMPAEFSAVLDILPLPIAEEVKWVFTVVD